MDFFNEHINQQLPQNKALEADDPSYTDREYSRRLTATKAGIYEIGPFSFTFNGKTYTSNTVGIEVIEPLAKQEGIWLRHVRFGGEEFVILEQQLRNTQKGSYSISSFERGEESDFEKAFASLLQQPAAGISMSRRHTSTTSTEANNNATEEVPLAYALQIYRIEKAVDFKGSLELSAQYFQNLPPNARLPKLVLR